MPLLALYVADPKSFLGHSPRGPTLAVALLPSAPLLLRAVNRKVGDQHEDNPNVNKLWIHLGAIAEVAPGEQLRKIAAFCYI